MLGLSWDTVSQPLNYLFKLENLPNLLLNCQISNLFRTQNSVRSIKSYIVNLKAKAKPDVFEGFTGPNLNVWGYYEIMSGNYF